MSRASRQRDQVLDDALQEIDTMLPDILDIVQTVSASAKTLAEDLTKEQLKGTTNGHRLHRTRR